MPSFHNPLHRPPCILDDDTRAAVLRRTADTMRELNKIRIALELPPAAIAQILEIYASSTREVVFQREQAALAMRSQRVPMKMTSQDRDYRPLRIRPGVIAKVTERPQWCAYRVEEIEIDGDPSRWRVHDIQVGSRPQSASTLRPIPGERFCKGGIMSELRLETCQTAMDFSLTVEYVGPLPEGEVFEATIVGTAAM